jgi:hypothetical protein
VLYWFSSRCWVRIISTIDSAKALPIWLMI